MKIIIPTVILVIIVIITAYLCYQKRKRKAEESVEVPEPKIRLSLLGTQYKIDDEVIRKTSQISQFSKESEASTIEFREKALVDSEFEQNDEIDPPGKYLSVNTGKARLKMLFSARPREGTKRSGNGKELDRKRARVRKSGSVKELE